VGRDGKGRKGWKGMGKENRGRDGIMRKGENSACGRLKSWAWCVRPVAVETVLNRPIFDVER